MIPYGKQDINKNDIDSIIDVLKSDFLTQGSKVPEFENSIIKYTGVEHACVMNSATSALHVACMALGLSEGDWLWTSPVTFVASANVGLYCKANVDFVDIDSNTYNMCPYKLEEKLIKAEQENKLPKILIPVHLSGQSCDMRLINNLCKKYNIKIIEDASHGIGGSYLDSKIGSCKYSDITVFSFHPVKIITTGEGGAATTNDHKLAEKMNLLRAHGITRDENLMTCEPHGSWYYQQIELGYNYRMTDIQAALGVSQMQRLDEFVEKRHEVAKTYNLLLKDLPIKTPFQLGTSYSAYHLYIIRLNLENMNVSHKKVFEDLRANGIGVNLHYIPVHLQPMYQKFGFKCGDFPESEKYYSEAISIPMYPGLSESSQNKVINSLTSIIKNK
jgi:UDP-4-amino-4,6-dideoxy-N-acetyl-beta-L-altrosamine transaminase